MTEKFVKYCIECKWFHSEECKPGINLSTIQTVPEDNLVHLCNHPTRRHLVTAKPVVTCSMERQSNEKTACGYDGKLWEKKDG